VVYPFLYWLEKGGFVMSERIRRGRREIKCYHLTDKGKDLLIKVRNLFSNPIRKVIADLIGER
ncbi:MAG: helix-turn-helix transcriptional regulator, partial [Nitrososphaerales archaeon]|nr:helix-turn-helix transcriptional regulator [Nitrososphaerales archaeon]